MRDVLAMSIEADVEGVLSLSNVLLSALPAIDQVDHIQVAVARTLNAWFMVALQKVMPVWIWLQVRQRLVPQGLLPPAGWSPAGLSSALTKRSRRFFGRR